jgi:hypothetical protein
MGYPIQPALMNMNPHKYLLSAAILMFAISVPGFSQNTSGKDILLKGLVSEQETNLPLSYASVGILEKAVGTIADSAGYYHLAIKADNLSDTLQISLVGYKTKKIAVNAFLLSKTQNIILERRSYILPEVIVLNKINKTEITGKQGSGKFIQISIHHKTSADEAIGSEMGMRYKAKSPTAVMKDFNWYFSTNNFNFIKLRVNIYSVKNNLPDTLLCNKQIYVTMPPFKTGWSRIDLTPYNITIHGDFIITLQWIESRMDKKEPPLTIIPIGMTLSKNCYVRIASQDKWERKGINLSFYSTLIDTKR